jgi:hypothetical protein
VHAIANIIKNDKSTIIVSLSNGRDVSTDNTSTYKPLILVTAFKGLRTLKALNELRLNPPPL